MGEGAVLPEGRQCMRSCLNGGGGGGGGGGVQSAYDGGRGQSAYDGGGGSPILAHRKYVIVNNTRFC